MSRVPVVLSQGQSLDVDQQHREDELIASLLMHPSAEATIITDLAQISSDSTDRLCLESIAGTALLFAWHTPQVASEVFERLGISARVIAESDDVVDANEVLAVHYFDLNEPVPPEFLSERIRKIAEEAALAPVALTDFVNGGKVPLVDQAANSGNPPQVSRSDRSTVVEPQRVYDDGPEDRDDLDDLMDAFDAVDL